MIDQLDQDLNIVPMTTLPEDKHCKTFLVI